MTNFLSGVVLASVLVITICIVALAIFLTTNKSSVAFPIDLVFTWVDPYDDTWRRQLSETKAKMGPEAQSYHTSLREPERTSKDIGYFAVLSALRHMPWLRKIWIVTQRPQTPSWLKDVHDSRLQVIHHDEFFDADIHRPTFNSVVIESQIFNIPKLSEHFILTNDDCLALQPLQPTDFFTPSGHPVIHTVLQSDQGNDQAWLQVLQRTNKLSRAFRPKYTNRVPLHTFLPLRKSTGQQIMRAMHSDIQKLQPVRDPANFVPQFIVAAMFAPALQGTMKSFTFYMGDDDFANDGNIPASACINEGFGQRSIAKLNTLLNV